MRAEDRPLGLATQRPLLIMATAFQSREKGEELETETTGFFHKVCSTWTKGMGLGASRYQEKWNEVFFF